MADRQYRSRDLYSRNAAAKQSGQSDLHQEPIQHKHQPHTASHSPAPVPRKQVDNIDHPREQVAQMHAAHALTSHEGAHASSAAIEQAEHSSTSAARKLFGEPLSREELDDLFRQEEIDVRSTQRY